MPLLKGQYQGLSHLCEGRGEEGGLYDISLPPHERLGTVGWGMGEGPSPPAFPASSLDPSLIPGPGICEMPL